MFPRVFGVADHVSGKHFTNFENLVRGSGGAENFWNCNALVEKSVFFSF